MTLWPIKEGVMTEEYGWISELAGTSVTVSILLACLFVVWKAYSTRMKEAQALNQQLYEELGSAKAMGQEVEETLDQLVEEVRRLSEKVGRD
jgi:hypothetical protein